MKSASRGDDTLGVEVSGISAHGVWLLLGDHEVFLPFKNFPWFRNASVAGVLHVERPRPDHLYWPDLDIDLSVESILEPRRFPLVSRDRPRRPLRRGGEKPRTRTKAARQTRRRRASTR